MTVAKILIIDDDEIVRDILSAMLTTAGHEIRLASDGTQGLQAFTEMTPDLVITDMLMPDKEGVETISDIRKLAAGLPIIAVSGGGHIGNLSFLLIAQKVGASRTFDKPFSPDEMLDAVSELLAAA
jgi:DNA-binding NtrC family response regulator